MEGNRPILKTVHMAVGRKSLNELEAVCLIKAVL